VANLSFAFIPLRLCAFAGYFFLPGILLAQIEKAFPAKAQKFRSTQMLKRYTFWLWTAVVVLFIAGAVHSVGLFISPSPANETERQMLDLMMHYKQDFGFGFHPTMWDLFRSLSSCFTFLCFLSVLTIGFLLKKRAASQLLQGIIRIHLLVFTVVLLVMIFLTFLVPIVFMALVVLCLAIGLATMPTKPSAAEAG
jgi:hypothetical protein